MKKFFLKYSFFFVGVLIALVIFNPPGFLRSIGWQGYLVLPVLCLLLLYIFFPGYSFVRSVYRKFELIPLVKQIKRGDICTLMDTLTSLGFAQAGPALDLSSYAAIIVPFVHEDAATYCVILRLNVGFGKTTFAFSSIMEDNLSGLTTFRERANAFEPRPACDFYQVFPKADMPNLFRHHLQGLEYLHRYGLNTRAVGHDTFVEDEKNGQELRKKFLRSNLIRHTLVFVWRFLTRRSPYTGPLDKQKIAQKNLRELKREPVTDIDTKSDMRKQVISNTEKMRQDIHTAPRHSGLGIASFMISMVIIGFFFFLLFLAVIIAVISPGLADTNSMLIRILGTFFMFASLANLVGLVLGIAAMRQIDRKKVFSILGLVFNLMIIAGMIVLIIIGRLIS